MFHAPTARRFVVSSACSPVCLAFKKGEGDRIMSSTTAEDVSFPLTESRILGEESCATEAH